MAQYEDRERFIPFRKAEIVDMLCADGGLAPADQEEFRSWCKILQSLYHFEFHDKVEVLKDNYYPFNPDKDTKTVRSYSPAELETCEKTLVDEFRELLNDANFEEITEADLERAMQEESLFKISLYVDFGDFHSHLLFWRGDATHQVEVTKFYVKKETIEVEVFERVAMLVKFKDADYFAARKRKNLPFQPGTMVIKLFKNIPKADLEMLFPNTQVRMKPKDKAMMGFWAATGLAGVATKAGVGILAAVAVIWGIISSFGDPQELSPAQVTTMVGGVSAIGVVGGVLWKQYAAYKNRKLVFMKTLADSLYFKNLDNNAGVFHHVVDAAEEEECKEAILGYYFLLQAPEGLTEEALDDRIEKWFEEKHRTEIDFEVDDALGKLKDLELASEAGKDAEGRTIYKVPTLAQACERLDYVWDNYFQYN